MFTSQSFSVIIFLLLLSNIFLMLLLVRSRQQSVIVETKNQTKVIPRVAPLLKYNICNHETNFTPSSTVNKMSNTNKMTTLAFNDINFDIGRYDNQRMYKIFDFASVGDSYVQASVSSDVCLATQSSIERLYSLPQVALHWAGPISVAVFAAGSEEFAVLQYYTTYMKLCFENIRNNVSFHVVVPHNNIPKFKNTANLFHKFNCQLPEHTLHRLLSIRSSETIKWRLKNIYPQNHLRNIARKGCQTMYTFLTDVDIIPSPKIVPMLNNFLRHTKCGSGNRCAYVIPTFEIDDRVKFPNSKDAIIRLYKNGLVRAFHEKVFIYNQYATNFSRWLTNSREGTEVYISHNVTNFEFLYEPFYVAQDNVPIHDERFLGYGFTRNSQVYEMFVAGFSFYVLSPVFTCHWGLQHKKSRPAWREQQNNMNRKRFEIFKNEILARYKNDQVVISSSKINKNLKSD